jgi:GNAT superfamily N-acetyltransferase
MLEVRRALPTDAAEVTRLRGVMLVAMDGPEGAVPGSWVDRSVALLTRWLDGPDPDVAVVVVDQPDGQGLAACAIGQIDRTLGDRVNPTGLRGRVFNVATDPGHRRRGYARACMIFLLAWFDASGVPWIDLYATVQGEPLYRDLGVVTRTPTPPGMRRLLDRCDDERPAPAG